MNPPITFASPLTMKIGLPNHNGRIYSDQCFESIKKKIEEGKAFVVLGGIDSSPSILNNGPSIDRIAGRITQVDQQDDGTVMALVELVHNNAAGRIASELLGGGACYLAESGVGKLEGNKVTDYQFSFAALVPKVP